MTTMTPTEQDNELREAIRLELKNVHRLAPADYTENCTNIVMQLITADRKRVAVEARIDEWKAMGDFLTKVDKEILSREFLDLYRLHGERLRAEREAL